MEKIYIIETTDRRKIKRCFNIEKKKHGTDEYSFVSYRYGRYTRSIIVSSKLRNIKHTKLKKAFNHILRKIILTTPCKIPPYKNYSCVYVTSKTKKIYFNDKIGVFNQ